MTNNYNDLQANVALLANRSDVADKIPIFISFAEQRFNRELRVREMEKKVVINISTGDSVIDLPDDFRHAKLVVLNTSNPVTLSYKSTFRLSEQERNGQPCEFTYDDGKMRLSPAADANYTITLSYFAAVEPLSDSNAANQILLNYDSLYIAATLSELFSWAVDGNPLNVWEGKTARIIKDLNKEYIMSNASGSPLKQTAGGYRP